MPAWTCRDIASLIKWRLGLAIASAAVSGYLLHPAFVPAGTAWLFLGVLALASGAGCLNNVQDRSLDARFLRTRDRPLAAGRIGTGPALALSVSLMTIGLITLAAAPFPASVPVTAALAAFCYNGLYTPLKTRSQIALAPGIVSGALPPLIGWLAAGGHAHDMPIWILVTVFGLWQPPHFWLIVLRHHDDYRAGEIPSMLSVFSRPQMLRILLAWTISLAMAMLALPFTAPVISPVLVVAIVGDAALLAGLFLYEGLIRSAAPNYRRLFICLNAAVFLGVATAVLHQHLA